MTTTHAWAIRLCTLHPGDALVVVRNRVEYRVCYSENVNGQACYVVWNGGKPLLNVVEGNERSRRRALRRVAWWLVNEGLVASDAQRCDADMLALRRAPVPKVIVVSEWRQMSLLAEAA